MVFGLLPGATPAQAFPGANGRIVFSSSRGDAFDQIYAMNADGTGFRRLTHNDSLDQDPAWSPDGGRIAFVSYRDGFAEIYGMNADGSGETNLTNSPDGELAPAWSADGTKIAFTRLGWIYVMNSDGTGQVGLGVSGSLPSWSPDGSKIAFSESDEIWVVNAADGSGATQLTTNDDFDAFPSWSPDGTKIAFVSRRDLNHEIYVMDADGSDQTRITNDAGGDFFPAWSPDGARIVFQRSSLDGPGLADIHVMSADGSNVRLLSPSNGDNGNADWQPVHLKLSASATRVDTGRRVTIRVDLLWHETTSNPEVSVYSTPWGGVRTLVASGEVNDSGRFAVLVTVRKRTVFDAEWSGDEDHLGGGVGGPLTVLVRPLVRGRMIGAYGTSGGYKLYHYTSSCPRRGTGCPRYRAEVVPNHAGKRLRFQLQLYVSGAWRTVLSFSQRIRSNGTVTATLVYGNDSVVGVSSRIRASFGGDQDHLPAKSRWAYFRVTR
jgi:dipeptidyl aminopeptidase/acylaminoacyl peptidase